MVMFLSAGHCGTRWLADALSALYPGTAVVEHEPLGPRYAPRRFFRRYDDPGAILTVPDVAAHITRIEQLDQLYLETGWPLFPALPVLADRLWDRLRVVHLTRHPVPSALDHVAERSYAGGARNDPYTRLATLGPRDRGVFQAQYAPAWDSLSPYEKCLFWWTEIGMFALEFPGRIDWVPFHRVQAERLLAGDREELTGLLEFIGLPWHDGWPQRPVRPVDRWQHPPDGIVNPLEVHRHPGTVDVAQRLGYDLSGLTLGALLAHYDGAPAYRD